MSGTINFFKLFLAPFWRHDSKIFVLSILKKYQMIFDIAKLVVFNLYQWRFFWKICWFRVTKLSILKILCTQMSGTTDTIATSINECKQEVFLQHFSLFIMRNLFDPTHLPNRKQNRDLEFNFFSRRRINDL